VHRVFGIAGIALLFLAGGCQSSADRTPAAATVSAAAQSASALAPFSCPSVNDINALAAVTLVASTANNSKNCQYTTTSAGVADTLVVLQHPPAGPSGQSSPTLAELRAQLAGAGKVVISAEPHYAAQAFIARSGTQSCTVFVLARDNQVMSVQEFHTVAATSASCAIAEAVVALAGTAASMAPGTSVSATAGSSPTPTPTSPPAPTATPAPRPKTEVPVFSTGPAASLQLPKPSR
jgi:hypothetical protein